MDIEGLQFRGTNFPLKSSQNSMGTYEIIYLAFKYHNTQLQQVHASLPMTFRSNPSRDHPKRMMTPLHFHAQIRKMQNMLLSVYGYMKVHHVPWWALHDPFPYLLGKFKQWHIWCPHSFLPFEPQIPRTMALQYTGHSKDIGSPW
jgi:hypothetical protein